MVDLKKVCLILLPIVGVVLGLCLIKWGGQWVKTFPKCWVLEGTGLYCPACGNTRCVINLIHGNIFAAIKYNPAPIIVIVGVTLVYIEGAAKFFFNKKLSLFPRKMWFWVTVGIFLFGYYILRNIVDIM